METFRREIPNNFNLPRRIKRLGQMAYNLWWVWNPESWRLFTHIDKPLWDQVRHNAVAFLKNVDPARLNAAINNLNYLEIYDGVVKSFDQHLKNSDTWFSKNYPGLAGQEIAYFSFEFGLHETLPVYAGGLGILSGDHLKESSDLGMPLVAVGFVYQQGYFTQRLSEDGWQETSNYYLNFQEMPIIPLYIDGGKPVMVSVDLPGRKVYARVWEVRVGRIPLYLLDSNVEENSPADRQLTARLYSNDPDTRISQEILLGIGGVRALRILGHHPTVWHMNEGHSAFLVLERAREYITNGSTFEQAAELIRKTNVFTTHTPVPAGNDMFPVWLVEKYFYQFWPQLKLDRDRFIELARQVQEWGGEDYSMPILALHLSDQCNAVSKLHGEVSRRMWNFLWKDKSEDEVPITHITNGVHAPSWLARRMRVLFDKYLGKDWLQHIDEPDIWQNLDNIPDSEFWAMRLYLKSKLVTFTTNLARQRWVKGGVHPVQIIAGGALLETFPLTIGFARRFATYKRGNLLFRDYDRLMRILTNANRPVQVVFAGKAHPADEPGKLIIQQVYRAVKDAKMGGRLVFIEDYDMNISRFLVQGVDVWLNTPRRPNEASGTSGMKAAMNGALNCSVLDGWWAEAYKPGIGWAVGEQKEYSDSNEQDNADANHLYNLLEKEIIPLYYESRSADDLPNEWVATIKESIRTLAPQFSMRRMVKQYMKELYLPGFKAVENRQIEVSE